MTHAATPQVTSALNCALDPGDDVAAGLTFPGLFGLIWNAHTARYGTTREQVAAVVIKNKANGARNPLAQMGGQIGLDEIVQSPLIADPLRRHDCCPISDGAAAVVLTTEALARRAGAEPVRVLASAQCRGTSYVGGHGDLTSFGATVAAANRAYADAGISARDLSFVELHDCFSIAEIADCEDLGIVPRGEGGRWALEGRTAVGGEMPINPSGGLLAKGHPVGATGVGQLYEVVHQLRGTHPNPVPGAAIGMTHNLGGTGVACTVSILRRGDA
jgi:acetyl-CoA C-acetyltransferase